MTAPTVGVEDGPDGVRVVTLDRPPANAIVDQLLADLDDALAAAEADEAVRAVVLTGAGRFFCAGFDFFGERRSEDLGLDMVHRYNRAHRRLLGLAKPTVALVRGHAVAGGLVLALACDHVVAAAGEYRIGLTEVAVGAGFPRAAVEIVRLRLPAAAAGRMILGAGLHGPEQLVALGVVDALAPPAEAEGTARTLAARIGGFSAASYRSAKAALVGPALAAIDAETDDEARASLAVWTSDESRAARAAMRAHLEAS